LQVAFELLAHRVDQGGHARRAIGEQIRVRRRLGIEELSDHHVPTRCIADASAIAAKPVALPLRLKRRETI
jgi:hypothetical protein